MAHKNYVALVLYQDPLTDSLVHKARRRGFFFPFESLNLTETGIIKKDKAEKVYISCIPLGFLLLSLYTLRIKKPTVTGTLQIWALF